MKVHEPIFNIPTYLLNSNSTLPLQALNSSHIKNKCTDHQNHVIQPLARRPIERATKNFKTLPQTPARDDSRPSN